MTDQNDFKTIAPTTNDMKRSINFEDADLRRAQFFGEPDVPTQPHTSFRQYAIDATPMTGKFRPVRPRPDPFSFTLDCGWF